MSFYHGFITDNNNNINSNVNITKYFKSEADSQIFQFSVKLLRN